MNPDHLAPIVVAIAAMGMALAFFVADRDSPTSRMLALFLACLGASIALDVIVANRYHDQYGIPPWDGIFSWPAVLAGVFAFEWLLRVRRTIPAGTLNTRGGDRLVRIAQGLMVLHGVLSTLLPVERALHFANVAVLSEEIVRPVFWVFAAPMVLAVACATVAVSLMLNRRPDRAEALRGISFMLGAPFMAASMFLPVQFAPLSGITGLMILLVGAVQYHVTQGRRAQFMARFLAPQVAHMVSRRGLKSATDEQTLELSVVCCDLRGFTAFSAGTSSKHVMQILREYYDAVGAAAASFGGTIKDQAGDGVLILVGAPIGFDDHAERALELARAIRAGGMAVTARWSDGELNLGVGVGVATGFVTVGVIGAASRLEYTAVGPAVNLAARLCSEAAHGEVLVDARTVECAAGAPPTLAPGRELRLKGFAAPVPSFVLAPA
ncbi:MAG: adenylate/guanylate cyclase domain-containing protein [Burkholderiales bacterium]|nr:adenylate/guanylate cyclase domain-containing protein [Burkholderiales bacterium]